MPTYVGVDIGATAIKVAVLKPMVRKTVLVALTSVDLASVPAAAQPEDPSVAAAPTPEGANGDAPPAAPPPAGRVPEAIRMALLSALGPKFACDGLAVAVDGSKAAVRTMMLPASVQKQLAEVLRFELDAQVPFDMENAVFDYRVLGRNAFPEPARAPGEKGDTSIAVVVGVARVDDVRERISLVNTAVGQEPERVGVGAFPLGNLVPYVQGLSDEAPIVLLDLGTKGSEVLILRSGEPVFARTLSFGTEGLPGTAPRLAREIRTTLAAYRAQGGATPTRVYLCGGGAFVSGAEAFLSGELELPVEVLPPPTFDVSNVNPAQLREMPRFAKAIGLALGLVGRGAGLNLRRGPLAYERGFGWVKEKVPLLSGLAAVVLVSFVFSTWAQLHAASKEREALEEALGIVTKEVLGEEATTAERANELLAKESALADEDPMPHADAFDVMVKLSEDIPQSMKHDIEELDVQKGHVIVHGIVGSIPEAHEIAEALKAEKCVHDIKIGRTSQQPGSDRQKYVMEFDFKCPEDIQPTPKKKGGASASASTPAGAGSPGGK